MSLSPSLSRFSFRSAAGESALWINSYHCILCLVAAFCPCLLQAQVVATQAPAVTADNSEIKTIFVADQFDRGNNPYAKPGDPQPKSLASVDIRKNDDARDIRIKIMLTEGLLHTGKDFYRAALVLQHSGVKDETLLAHILATVAISKGEPSALWLSAATLDRYLVQVGRKQVFGTQFKSIPKTDETKPYTFVQDDVDMSTVSDAMRAEFCVSALASQQKGLPGPLQGTSLTPCLAKTEMGQLRPTNDH